MNSISMNNTNSTTYTAPDSASAEPDLSVLHVIIIIFVFLGVPCFCWCVLKACEMCARHNATRTENEYENQNVYIDLVPEESDSTKTSSS